MKKTRILSLLLCLSLFSTLIVPGTRAYAESDPDNGMKISKTATANSDGSYTITLEAFATGSKTTTVQEKDIPTDIILVLDQSGSMADDIGQVQYTAYTGNNTQNKNNYGRRHNGGSANLWHKLKDGSFVSVSVTLQQTITYNKITKGRNDNSSSGYTNYWENRNNLYTYVNGEIKKVVYTRERDYGWQNWNCKYALEDGTILNQNNEGSRHSPTFQNTDDGYLYLAVANENQNVYTYTYTDTNGTTQTIGTSTGANTRFTPAFYQRSTTTSGGGSRLNALKSAANAFANAVAVKAAGEDGDITTTADNIDHRIAVVGYADTDWDYGYNTGVFIGSTLNRYENNAAGVYSTALQDMSTTNGKSNVAASLNALQASGATRTDYGLIMAKGILDANPVPTGEMRNRVVIVFTDGSPTDYNGFQKNVANSAISTANAIKAGGTTVYSIGIFSGADASSAGTEPSGNLSNSSSQLTAACNWFMQQVSSNNGTPRYPSYYLSAGDAASLNSIFQQISNNITTGGSSTTLGSETVVKDIISPYFTLPAGTTASGIRIDTYDCTGKDGNTYTWSSTSGGSGGASAKVNGDQVSVTGFNFSENWCGTETDAQGNTTVRGKKLVISFDVQPKPGFFGGNGVVTNTSAGIYENGSAQTPVMTFEQPTVDVPLAEPEVTVPDANVYLGAYYSQTVPEDAVKLGATVKIGGYDIDFSKADDPDHPYGLEPWQVEYVNISISAATTGNGGSFENIQEDISYTVTVTVSPKTPGTSGDQSTTDTGTGTIHVFKPELTFKDSDVWYGGAAPENYNGNLVEETWVNSDGTKKHDDADVTMLNTKPLLTLNYIPEAGKIDANSKINTKQDIKVKVDVTMPVGQTQTQTNVNAHTTFKHTPCTDETCGWTVPTIPGDPAFLLHVKTCTLTVSKTGGADNESYVFDVFKDGEKYSEVTVWGNGTETLVELPIGTYTISENTGWSWRYSANNGGSAALTAQNPTGSIACTNTKNNNQWLNGFSEVVRNIFGTNH